jgi:16S rRNA (guanine1207-N2)-methyltransferase
VFVFNRNGLGLTFETTPVLFSPNAPDKGTLTMLDAWETDRNIRVQECNKECNKECVNDAANNPGRFLKLLDLGCGYGLAGLYLAKKYGDFIKITMCDNDISAIEAAQKNALINGLHDVDFIVSDGFRNIPSAGFDYILSNPPYHTDFSVAKHFIEKGFNRLAVGGAGPPNALTETVTEKPGGKLYMVVKRREWYKQKFISVFGGVTVTEREGYFVFCGERRSVRYAKSVGREIKHGI